MQELLLQKRDEIVRGWIDAALGVFPAESAGFLNKVKDPFANPLGNTIRQEIGFLFDAVVREAPDEELDPHLDRIVKVTCIQDVAPSRSIAFVFELRRVLRQVLADGGGDRNVLEWLLHFEDRIDRVALRAFESHARQRQKISDIRVEEIKRKVSTLVKMAGLDWDDLPSNAPSQGGCGR